MNMTPIKGSSQIAAIGHEGTTLRIHFIHGDTTYEYQNVSPALYKELLKAPSVGKAFASAIKSNPTRFPFKKLGENGAQSTDNGKTEPSTELSEIKALTLLGDGYKVIVSPAAEKLKKELITQSLKIKVVDSDASSEVARGVLKNLASFRQGLEKTRKLVKQPFLDGCDEVDRIAREFGAIVKEHEDRIGGTKEKDGLISAYAREQEMKRRQAEEDAKRLAEEAERKEREAEESRIAAEAADRERCEALEEGKKKQAEKLRLEALAEQRKAEAAELAEEKARAASMQASMAAMAEPVKGTKMEIAFSVEDIHALYRAKPEFVKMEVRTREVKEFLNLQRERGLPVGLPGLTISEAFKTSSRG